jgi:hypothetical protein
MASDRFGQSGAGEIEFFRHDVVTGNLSRPAPPLKAVLSGDREIGIAENGINVRNRAPADESEGAPGSIVKLENQATQDPFEYYLGRRRRNVDQGSVDVEEIGP